MVLQGPYIAKEVLQNRGPIIMALKTVITAHSGRTAVLKGVVKAATLVRHANEVLSLLQYPWVVLGFGVVAGLKEAGDAAYTAVNIDQGLRLHR